MLEIQKKENIKFWNRIAYVRRVLKSHNVSLRAFSVDMNYSALKDCLYLSGFNPRRPFSNKEIHLAISTMRN